MHGNASISDQAPAVLAGLEGFEHASLTKKNCPGCLSRSHRDAACQTETDSYRIRDHIADLEIPPARDELSEFERNAEGHGPYGCGDNEPLPLVHRGQESQDRVSPEMFQLVADMKQVQSAHWRRVCGQQRSHHYDEDSHKPKSPEKPLGSS